MADVYTTQLAGYKALASDQELVTADGVLTVFTSAQFWDGEIVSLTGGTINVCGTEGQTFIQFTAPAGASAGSFQTWAGRHAIGPGQTWTIVQSGDAVDLSICGFQLYLP